MQWIHRNNINPVLQPCLIKLRYRTFGFHQLTTLAVPLESYAESLKLVIVLRYKFAYVPDKRE